MKQLIKQIFKSLKSSLLLILSLIFLSFCIIFVSSSSLFINWNLNNSVTSLRADGNSTDVIVDKKYNSSDIQYTHSAPKPKQIRVSNYVYNNASTGPNHLQNIIFPYQSSDFNSSAIVNEQWTLKPGETAPAYYDINLPRYGNRKFGLLKGGTIPTKPIPAKPNLFNGWYGMGYSMTNRWTGEKLFDPKFFIFDSTLIGNQANLVGYFNEGAITNEITLAESQMAIYTPNATFTYATNQGIAMVPFLSVHQNVIWHYKLDLNPFLNDYGYYYGDLLTSLRSNTREITTNAWTLNLDPSSLKGIDLFVYNEMQKILTNNPTLFADYKKIISEEFVIRDEWIDEYIINSGGTLPTPPDAGTPEQIALRKKIIGAFLYNRKKQLINNFNLFVKNNKDLFIKNYIKQLGYVSDDGSSFSFYDRETKWNFLVSKKEDSIINKIVLSDGITLANSSKYQGWYSSIYGKLLSIVGYNNIDEKAMKEGAKSLIDFLYRVAPTLKIDPKLANDLEILAKATVDAMTNTPTDRKIPWMLKKLFSYFSEPTFALNNYQNVKININYQANSSILDDRGFDAILPILDNYTIMTTQKFIDSSNKQVLPQSSNDTNNWEYAKRLSPKDFISWFNNLDPKYTLNIGINKLIIIGTGLSPEMAYPAIDFTNLVPDAKTDILVYVNDSVYNTIWTNSGKPFNFEYFTVLHNYDSNNVVKFISTLNKDLIPVMNNSSLDVVSRLDNNITNNILSMRYGFPNVLNDTIFIASNVFVIILSLLAMYLFYIILKKYIDQNKVQLSIIKANGLSTIKIAVCFSIVALAIAIFSGLVGLLLSYFFQPLIFLIFSPYIFIPPIFSSFSFLLLIGGIASIFLIAMLFVFIYLHYLFKKPLNLIMSQNIEVKYNVLLSVLKYKNGIINSGNKFKIALFMSNPSRTLFYILGCITGISLITVSLTLTNKFRTSKDLTNINKNYIYNIDLVSPTDQSGLYKTQNYVDLGLTNNEMGITSLYKDTEPGPFPYTKNQLQVYKITSIDSADNIIAKVPKLDKKGNPLYYGNIALPSLQIYNHILTNPDSLRNAVMVKWILDFDIKIPIVGVLVNAWERVKALLPPEIVSKIATQEKEFKTKLLATPGIGKLYKSYCKINPLTNEYVLDGDKIITPPNMYLNQPFLDFLGLVYGDENLSASDTKISWATMPINPSTTETYTYVDADIIVGNQRGKSKIFGINPYSQYLNLKDNSKQSIGYKLKSPDNNIIINNGAALKYKLGVGDKINIKVNNSYFRYTNKIMGLETFVPSEFTFNVVGINSTSFGEEFFINQKIANKITYLDKGTFVSKINPTNPAALPMQAIYQTVTTPYQSDPLKLNYYEPYNGLLCNTNNPIYLSKTLSFYSLINLYGQIGRLSLENEQATYLLSTINTNYIAEAFLTKSDWIIDQYNKLNQSNSSTTIPVTRVTYKDDFLKVYNNQQILINYMNSVFGENVMFLTMENILNYNTSQIIYTTLIGTLDSTQILIMSLMIPIIVLTILIMSSVILNEIRSMLSVLKTLGYSDKQNISNILFTFLPIFIISVLFSLAVLAIFLISFQSVIYYFLSVYISSSINFLEFLYAVLAIFAVLTVSILSAIYSYKHSKLNMSIIS